MQLTDRFDVVHLLFSPAPHAGQGTGKRRRSELEQSGLIKSRTQPA